MLDIPSIMTVVASIGVLVGVALAYLEVRTLVRTRQTDIITNIYSMLISKDRLEAWEKVRDREVTNYKEYKKKYGLVEVNKLTFIYDLVGVLLRRKLIDISLVQDLFGTTIKLRWTKLKPLIEGGRKHHGQPDILEHFEYLYNEMQKREQRLQQTQQ